MNILNVVIIGIALISITTIIVVVVRSLKNVDEEIEDSLIRESLSSKKKTTQIIQQYFISLIEFVIRRLKFFFFKIHKGIVSWKRKSGDKVVAAKKELELKDDNEEKFKEDLQLLKPKKGSDIVKSDEIFYDNDGDDIGIDSAKNIKSAQKSSFISGLFKKNDKNAVRKTVDIKSSEKEIGGKKIKAWSLNGQKEGRGQVAKKNNNDERKNDENNEEVGLGAIGEISINKQQDIEIGGDDEKVVKKVGEDKQRLGLEGEEVSDNDMIIGVDRSILEKKILQKIDNNPKDMNNYYELGELYIKMNKLNDALEVYEYIISVLPRDVNAKRKIEKVKFLKRLGK